MADVRTTLRVDADVKQALAKIQELNQAISLFNRSVNQQNAESVKAAKGLEQQVLGAAFARNFDVQYARMSGSVENFSKTLDKGKVSMGSAVRLMRKDNDMLSKVAERRVKLMNSMQVALTGQIRGGQRGAILTPQSLSGLEAGTKQVEMFGRQLSVAAQKSIVFHEAIRQGSTSMVNWGKNMQWAGRQLMVGLTLPIAAFGLAAVKAFSDVEEQMISIRRVYGDLETTDYQKMLGVAELDEAARSWTQYGVSLKDSLEVASVVAATGARGAEAVAQLNQAIRFATLGNLEYAQSQEAIIAMQSAMGVQSEELAMNIDFLNAVENQTLLTMQDFTDAVPRVGPVLKDMGGDVQDLATFLTAMREGGVGAAEGANALKSGLASLINPTREAKEMLSQFGVDIGSIVENNQSDPVALIQELASELQGLSQLTQQRIIEQLFGKYQFARWSALFDNISRSGSQAQEVLELAGMSAEELASISSGELDKIAESPLIKFRAAMEELKNALIPIGQQILEVLTPIIGVVTKIAEIMGNSAGATVLVGALIALVGPVAMLTGLFANFIGNVVKFGNSLMTAAKRNGSFMTEVQISSKVAATALDDFQSESLQTIAALDNQGIHVEKLANEYRQLASVITQTARSMASTGFLASRSAGIATSTGTAYKVARGMQTGGQVPGGFGGGDRIPALLEPGEFVVNKTAARKFGSLLSDMNDGDLRTMADGGDVSRYVPGAATRSFGGLTNELIVERGLSQKDAQVLAREIFKAASKTNVDKLNTKELKILRQTTEKLLASSVHLNTSSDESVLLQSQLADLFGDSLRKERLQTTQRTHLLEGKVYTGGTGLQGMLPGSLAVDIQNLSRLLGSDIKTRTYSSAAFSNSAIVNQRFRHGGGMPLQEYVKEQQALAPARQGQLNSLLGTRFESGTMGQVDAKFAQYMKDKGITNVSDKVIDTEFRNFAASLEHSDNALDQLIVAIRDAAQEVTIFSNSIDAETRHRLRQQYGQGMKPGEERIADLGGGYTQKLVKDPKSGLVLLGGTYSPKGTQVVAAENVDWRDPQKPVQRFTPGRRPLEGSFGGTRAPRTAIAWQNRPAAAELAAKDMVRGAEKAARQELQALSPSELFADVGDTAPQGFGKGIERSSFIAENEAREMVAEAQQASWQQSQSGLWTPPVKNSGSKKWTPAGGATGRVAFGPLGGLTPLAAAPQGASEPLVARETIRVQGQVAASAQDVAIAQGEVAEQATNAAESTKKLDKSTNMASGGMSKFSKFTFALDAITGAMMILPGPLQEVASKLFLVSSALTSMALMSQMSSKGEKAGKFAKAGGVLKGGAKGGGIAGAAKAVPGALMALAGGPWALAIGGTIAAVVGIGIAMKKLNDHMNRFDKALQMSEESLKKFAETAGFQLKTPSGAISGATGEEISAVQEAMDTPDQKRFVEYAKSLGTEATKQTALARTSMMLARGMPKEMALEFAKQLSSQIGISPKQTENFIKDLYTQTVDEEGNVVRDEQGEPVLELAKDAGDKIAAKIADPFALMVPRIERVVEQVGMSSNQASGRGELSTDYERAVGTGGYSGSLEDYIRQYGDQGAGYAPVRTPGKQELESLANSASTASAALSVLYQEQMITGKEYMKRMNEINAVVAEYGGANKAFIEEWLEIDPALAPFKDSLMESTELVNAQALSMAGLDLTGMLLAMAGLKDEGYSAEEALAEFDSQVRLATTAVGGIKDAVDELTSPYKQEIERLQKEQTDNAKAIDTETSNIEDLQEAIDLIDEADEAQLTGLRDQIYDIDTALGILEKRKWPLQDAIDGHEEIVERLQEQGEKYQDQLEAIDEIIEKIDERRQKEIDNIEEIADAQVDALNEVLRAQDRAAKEESSLFNIGSALAQGDVAGALQAQQDYTQEFGADSIQEQIDAVEEWRKNSIDAINAEADAKVEAEDKKRKAIEKSIEAVEKQIEQQQDYIKAINKQVAAIDKEAEALNRKKEQHNDTIRTIERNNELEKRGYETKIDLAEKEIKRLTDKNKTIQDSIDKQQSLIDGIEATGQATIDAVDNIAREFNLTKEAVNELVSGQTLTNYIKTGNIKELEVILKGEQFHSGGAVQGGSRHKGLKSDEVPAVLQTGEYVVQRSAVNKLGKQKLDQLNQGMTFHEGGFVAGFGNLLTNVIGSSIQKNISTAYATIGATLKKQLEESATARALNPIGAALGAAISGPTAAGWWWPTPGYAQNRDEFGDPRSGGRKHSGWDIGIPNGYPVRAIKPGVVTNIGSHNVGGTGAGIWGAIGHGGGLYTRYLHMQGFNVGVGDKVKGGQVIGRGDSTGTSVPHLHFEITRDNLRGTFSQSTNPINFFGIGNPYNYHSGGMVEVPEELSKNLPATFHQGGIVGSNEIPAILEKGELVIPKDGYSMSNFDTSNVSMPTFNTSSGANIGAAVSQGVMSGGGGGNMPTFGAAAGGGGGSDTGTTSNNSNVRNNYNVRININGGNGTPTDIANAVYAKLNRNDAMVM